MADVQRYTADRIGIVAAGTWTDGAVGREAILELATQMLRAHQRYFVQRGVAGEIYDAISSFQLNNEFEIRGVLEGYVEDELTDGWSALIVWNNSDRWESA